MSKIEKYTNNTLIIEVEESDSEISIHFEGRSTDRDPSIFILPILQEALQNSEELNKKIIIDFQDLEFMNSSTIKPMIKILEITKNTSTPISIFYKPEKKWQGLLFLTLKIFETKDLRIEITGK